MKASIIRHWLDGALLGYDLADCRKVSYSGNLPVSFIERSLLRSPGELMSSHVPTPCTGACSISIGDNVCRGCKRFPDEVTGWNSYTEDQRFMVAQRLELLLMESIKSKLEVFDSKSLFSEIKKLKVRFVESQSALCWVFCLLRARAGSIANPEQYGFRLLPQCRGASLSAIYSEIEQEFLLSSKTHYDRYIAPGVEDCNLKTA